MDFCLQDVKFTVREKLFLLVSYSYIDSFLVPTASPRADPRDFRSLKTLTLALSAYQIGITADLVVI